MKLKKQLIIWVFLSFTSVLFYQNCGQQGQISLKVDPEQTGGEKDDICQVNPTHPVCTNIDPVGKIEEYRYIDVSQPVIPDLKIFLILDNSDSMRVSQVNLVNNIEKMFSANGDGLRDYNSEIFIITTAQLNNIGNQLVKTSVDFKNDYMKVLEKLYYIDSTNFTSQLLSFLRPNLNGAIKTNGLLAGDMIGFYAKSKRTPSSVGPIYDTFENTFYPAYLTHPNQPSILSVKFTKGGSITELVDKLKERVELLNPDSQVLSKSVLLSDNSTVDNVPLSDVVEKESGMCALGRVLNEAKNNPEGSLIKKGELATFILVSDEEEHDIAGAECVKSYKFQQPLPGTLYRGICADDEASAYYEIPDKRDWKLEVKKPYIKNIRQAQEHINSQINKVDGQCSVNFRQSYARLKVLKNSHKVKFSRKIANSDGSTYIKSWSHDLNFNRVNKKYTFTFDRKSLKHKVKFDRTSLKHQVLANRKLITPVYSVAISRDLISKYQSVSYIRKVILTKEGNKQVEVSNSGTLNIKIPGVNISANDCTTAWLAARPEIKALETPLSSSSESYSYSVSSCAIANTIKTESFSKSYSGTKPTSCDVSFAELVFPKSVMQSNDEYKYNNINCTQLANNVAAYNFNSADISGEAPTGSNCNASYAAAKDSSKPNVDTSLGQQLSYENVICQSSNSTASNVELTGFSGNCSQVGDLLTYIKLKDGSLANVSYANMSCVDTNVSSIAQTRTEVGTYSGSSCADSIKSLEGNLANTVYENCSVAAANVTDSYQSIKGIAGQYTYTNDTNLIAYIRVKDGNKSVDSTDYNLTSINIVGKEKYVNIPAYADDVALYSVSIDGKVPGVCDLNYASLKDTAKPSLAGGQYLVYYDVSCVANAQTTYQLTRGSQIIKYDGSYGNSLIPYESSLESIVRDCSGTEKNDLISAEASKSPALVIDGNILEFSSCKVSNSALAAATTESNNILKLINSDSNVLVATNSNVCSTAISSYCASGATNNPNGYYGCLNNAASFVPYVAFKAEKRKYVLKSPVFLSEKKELHWFGFEPIQITTLTGATQAISLLSYLCEDVVGACEVDSVVNKMTVENYFKQKYASGDENVWSSIKKVSFSDQTVSDPSSLTIACAPDTLVDYTGSSDSRKDYDICNNKSVNASKSFDIVYDASLSNVVVTKNINDVISCDEVCTADTCKAKDGSRELIPITTNENGVTRALTMKEFYGGNCSVNPNYVASAQVSKRNLAKIKLSETQRDNIKYDNGSDICNLTCKDSGLCKAAVNSVVDSSGLTIKEFIAKVNGISATNVSVCKSSRVAEIAVENKSSQAEVEVTCTKPSGAVLASKYIKNKNISSYLGSQLPNGHSEFILVRENSKDLKDYATSSFASVIGDGFVSMATFTSKAVDNGKVLGADYDDLARSVNGIVKDVKASSDDYGVALKFLGEKVSSQLKSSFQLADVDPSQQVTKVWYSSWFTKGKFIQLSPTDFSASGPSIVITNPAIIEKMKNEAAFKFFVEIF